MSDEYDPIEDDPIEPVADVIATPKDRRKRKNRIEYEAEQGREFWRKVLADEVGRREIWNHLQTLGTFTTNFACGPNGFPQSEATYFNLGKREAGVTLYDQLRIIDFEGVQNMHLEHDPRFPKKKRVE